MSDDEISDLAAKIALDLFTDGHSGQTATRLALVMPHQASAVVNQFSGWGLNPMQRRIEKIIRDHFADSAVK